MDIVGNTIIFVLGKEQDTFVNSLIQKNKEQNIKEMKVLENEDSLIKSKSHQEDDQKRLRSNKRHNATLKQLQCQRKNGNLI